VNDLVAAAGGYEALLHFGDRERVHARECTR